MTALEGKTALITGGARGQGASHALALAAEGADVAICDISTPAATPPYGTATADDLRATEKAVLATGRRCLAVEADVRDRGAVRELVARTLAELGPIDIVIANAGIITYNSVWELTDEQWDEVVDTNLTGVWNTVRACVPSMIEAGRGGSIVLVSSTAGKVAVPGAASYTAAKHGVVGLTKSLAVELSAFNIRVNAIHPTGVATPMVLNQASYDMFCGHAGGTEEEAREIGSRMNLLPVGFVDPAEVSRTVLYLVGDDSRWVTGASLMIDAGATVNPAGDWRNAPEEFGEPRRPNPPPVA